MLCVSVALAPWAGAADLLRIEEAVAAAVAHNRSVEGASLNAGKARERVAATRTRQYPSFSVYVLGAQQLLSFEYALERGMLGQFESGPAPADTVHLRTPRKPTGLMMNRVQQPLTSLIRIRRNLDALRTGVALAEEESREEQQKVAREVKRVYYRLQQVESDLRTVQETAGMYREIERLTSGYVLQQVALKGDLLEAQTRLARTHQTQLAIENQRATAKEQLNLLLGRDVLTDFEVEPAVEVNSEQPDLQEARSRALRNRPEIRQARLRQVQAEQDVRAKKAEYIPEVSVEFNNLSFFNWGRFMPTQSTSVGVSLSWEPMDWGRRRHELAEKKIAANQTAIAIREAENRVLVEVNDKFRQVEFRRAELGVARLAQESALENLRVIKNKFAVQAALMKDVLQTQVSLEQSNGEHQQALTAYWNAKAEFERAIGEEQ
jgi:outer membrane protein TolC